MAARKTNGAPRLRLRRRSAAQGQPALPSATRDLSSSTVFVVDDDPQMRQALHLFVSSVGMAVRCFGSATEFLEAFAGQPGCLILDLRLPGMSGLALHERLRASSYDLPVIFLTGYGEVPVAVRAIQNGAIDFLEKPVSHQALLDRLHAALAADVQRRVQRQGREEFEWQCRALTPREREVLHELLEGHSSKRIAHRFQISDKTVDKHKSRILRKMGVATVVQLLRHSVAAR